LGDASATAKGTLMAEFVVNPQDVERVWRAAQSIGNPIGIAKRFAGLGEAEQRAGVPSWAWLSLAVGVGVIVGMQLRPKVDDFLRNHGLSR
jgi:hypothetical protein